MAARNPKSTAARRFDAFMYGMGVGGIGMLLSVCFISNDPESQPWFAIMALHIVSPGNFLAYFPGGYMIGQFLIPGLIAMLVSEFRVSRSRDGD